MERKNQNNIKSIKNYKKKIGIFSLALIFLFKGGLYAETKTKTEITEGLKVGTQQIDKSKEGIIKTSEPSEELIRGLENTPQESIDIIIETLGNYRGNRLIEKTRLSYDDENNKIKYNYADGFFTGLGIFVIRSFLVTDLIESYESNKDDIDNGEKVILLSKTGNDHYRDVSKVEIVIDNFRVQLHIQIPGYNESINLGDIDTDIIERIIFEGTLKPQLFDWIEENINKIQFSLFEDYHDLFFGDRLIENENSIKYVQSMKINTYKIPDAIKLFRSLDRIKFNFHPNKSEISTQLAQLKYLKYLDINWEDYSYQAIEDYYEKDIMLYAYLKYVYQKHVSYIYPHDDQTEK